MWGCRALPGAGAPPCATRFGLEKRAGAWAGGRVGGTRWKALCSISFSAGISTTNRNRNRNRNRSAPIRFPTGGSRADRGRIEDDGRRPRNPSASGARSSRPPRRGSWSSVFVERLRRGRPRSRRWPFLPKASSSGPSRPDPGGDASPRQDLGSAGSRVAGWPDSTLCSRVAHVTRCDSPSRSPSLRGRERYVGLPGLPGAGAPPCATSSTDPDRGPDRGPPPPPVSALRSTPPACADDSLSSRVAHVTR